MAEDGINITNHAGFHKRALAFLLDSIIAGTTFVLPALVIYPTLPRIVRVIGLPICIAAWWTIYFALFESSKLQATPGKKCMRIIVTSTNGEPISLFRAITRNMARHLSSCFFFLGYLMIDFTPKKQTLHDLIASTLVLNREDIAPAAEAN